MLPAGFPAFRAVPVVTAAVGAVALAVATTACGSSASSGSSVQATRMSGTGTASVAPASPHVTTSAPASTAKLTGPAASALATRAFANTQAASSVQVTGQSLKSGSGNQAVSFDITLVNSVGCAGTISLSKVQTFKIVETDGDVWLLPNPAFYSSLHLNKAAVALVQGKYIRVKSTDSQISSVAKICSFSGLFGSLPKVTGTGYVATPGAYRGIAAYQLTQAGSAGSAFISAAAKPLLLEISDPSSNGGAIAFTNYDAVTTITPPTDAESIDGSQLGV